MKMVYDEYSENRVDRFRIYDNEKYFSVVYFIFYLL